MMSFERTAENMEFTPEKLDSLERGAKSTAAKVLEGFDPNKGNFSEAARAAYTLGDMVKAREYANASLALAGTLGPGHWNYGNAFFAGETVLGFLALDAGDIDGASQHLIRSGAASSPQLDSFGPSMALARRLLLAEQWEAVSEFLVAVRAHWQSGANWLDCWEEKIAARQVPSFSLHRFR